MKFNKSEIVTISHCDYCGSNEPQCDKCNKHIKDIIYCNHEEGKTYSQKQIHHCEKCHKFGSIRAGGKE